MLTSNILDQSRELWIYFFVSLGIQIILFSEFPNNVYVMYVKHILHNMINGDILQLDDKKY